jgi:hypothetical protein
MKALSQKQQHRNQEEMRQSLASSTQPRIFCSGTLRDNGDSTWVTSF